MTSSDHLTPSLDLTLPKTNKTTRIFLLAFSFLSLQEAGELTDVPQSFCSVVSPLKTAELLESFCMNVGGVGLTDCSQGSSLEQRTDKGNEHCPLCQCSCKFFYNLATHSHQ